MIYTWKDKTSGKEVEVHRPAAKYEEEPTRQESGLTEEEYDNARWTRVVTGGSFTKGFNQKGHW